MCCSLEALEHSFPFSLCDPQRAQIRVSCAPRGPISAVGARKTRQLLDLLQISVGAIDAACHDLSLWLVEDGGFSALSSGFPKHPKDDRERESG